MPKQIPIKDSIRDRVLEAINDIQASSSFLPTTNAEVMESLGEKKQMLSDMKYAKRRWPSLQMIVGLATQYNYSLNWLMLGSGYKKAKVKTTKKKEAIELLEEALLILKTTKK